MTQIVRIECPTCKGRKWILAKRPDARGVDGARDWDEVPVKCPRCHGTGEAEELA